MRIRRNLLAPTLPLAAQPSPADDHVNSNRLVLYMLDKRGFVERENSYANRETDTIRKGFPFNAGLNTLLDKLLSVK
jgi:hypothetical protein